MDHVDDLLAELALRTLSPEDLAAVESHVRDCARCSEEFRTTVDALAWLAATAPTATPSLKVREQLFARVRNQSRWAPFVERVAELFDLTVEKAEALLETLADAGNWVPGPGGGTELYFVPKGPRLAGAEAGFLRLDANVQFPKHRHLGQETAIIMDGSLREDGSDRVWQPGDVQINEAGTEHSFTAGENGCLFAVVVVEGVDFSIGPG
jgi:putative transcriptional regulator